MRVIKIRALSLHTLTPNPLLRGRGALRHLISGEDDARPPRLIVKRIKSMQKLLLPSDYLTPAGFGLFHRERDRQRNRRCDSNSIQRISLFYKIDIQQGNSIEQPIISRLEPGMSKNQVQFIMGTLMLIDVFHLNRWDYYYSIQRGNGESAEHIALFFEDDKLVRTEGICGLRLKQCYQTQGGEVFSVPDYNDTKGNFLVAGEDRLRRRIEEISNRGVEFA